MEYLNWAAEHPFLTLFVVWAIAGCISAPFKQKIDININRDDDKDKD